MALDTKRSMKRRKEHGERNKRLSKELLEGKLYYDWSVTTAFYAAIHFVEDKILPCEVSGKRCTNINEVKKAYKMQGRHASRERLVFDKLNLDVGVKYKWLDDRSRYSRYTTYKLKNQEAEKAMEYLEIIYIECYNDGE